MNSPISNRSAPAQARAGYSILELTSVLAILAILAAVVTENVIERVRRGSRDAEASNLTLFASALNRYILRSKIVPGTSSWLAVLSAELSLPNDKVQYSASGVARMLFIDPALRIGTNSASVLPYTQTVLGSVQPVSPRLIILSSLSGALPTLTQTTNTFASVWNTQEDQMPSGWPSSWVGSGKDLKIERLELRDLFHKIVLNNLDVLNNARYSIETTNTMTYVAVGGRVEAWFLDGTAVNFHYGNGTMQAREFIHEDASYVYENGRWGRYVTSGRNSLAGAFGQMVDAFLATSLPSDPKFNADQQAVVDDMYNYLWYFAAWANDGFPPESNPSHPQVPEVRVSTDAQDRLADFSDNLID